jgi:3-deoxy-D-manno-octulosonic-acid transferase
MTSDLPLSLRLYRGVSAALTPAAGILIRQRLKQGKEDAARIDERKGISALARPPGPLVWVHGASVGEILAAAALIEHLRAMGISIVLTSGTATSAGIASRRFPPGVIHQFIPYDSPRFVARFLDHWQPSFGLFIESDLWPNLVMASNERRIPIIIINGRMSPRSYRRWKKAPRTIGALLGAFDMCLAQSDGDADRFASLGSPHVFTTGNLKFDEPPPSGDPVKLDRLNAMVRGRPIVVAASTHPGEDEILIDAHRRLANYFTALLTIIVPRHPQRGADIEALVEQAELRPALRSRGELPTAQTDIYVADTMGELGLFYRMTPVVFMGGSLVEHGGQNPIEAIKLGAAVVHGPHVTNFADTYEQLDNHGGARMVENSEMLVRQIGQWLADDPERQRASAAGLKVVRSLGGALDRTLAALEPYLLQLRLESATDA